MCGLLRCKEGNNVCNFPYNSYPMSWLHFHFMGIGGLEGIMYPGVSELSSLLYYLLSQST